MRIAPQTTAYTANPVATSCSLARAVAGSISLFLLGGCHSHHSLPAPGTQDYAQYTSAFYTGLAGLQVGDDARAATYLQKATQLVSEEPAGWADWGVLALRQRDFGGALERLQKAHSLVPTDAHIDFLLGLVKGSQGDSAGAIAALRDAVTHDPHNLRALYRMASEIERQGEPGSDAKVQQLLQQLLHAQPNNLATLVDLCRVAAKRGDAATLHATLDRISQQSKDWPPEALDQLRALQAAASANPRAGATRSVFLRNVLMRQSEFRVDLSQLAAQPGEEAEPIVHLLRMQNPPSQPSPADMGLSFMPHTVSPTNEQWSWAGVIDLNGSDAPVVAQANKRHLLLANGADLLFATGASALSPGPDSILALDYNYDFKNDLLLANGNGLRLYRQDAPNTFTDTTAAMKLSHDITAAAYTGAWAADIEADGDLDVLLGTQHGTPSLLQNNGDGTFTPTHPFAGITGIQQFAWADLNGDGSPDAALIDGAGKLHIFLNQRAGHFSESPLKNNIANAAAIAIGDTGRDGFLRLHVLRTDGTLDALAWSEINTAWSLQTLAHLPQPLSGQFRMQSADIDNNGATDLIVMRTSGSATPRAVSIFLQETDGAFHAARNVPDLQQAFDVADAQNDGHLAIIGIDPQGRPTVASSHGTKQYRWQTIWPRARQATGDQRVNPFGIGGDIEIRSGLLVQKQSINKPAVHFGLGDRDGVDVARIVWPNGTVRAEFNLKANQQVVTEQRLKGSCPFLFAWNGTHMAFVKDSVPWGSAIGLRINSLGTAKISATEEWYKIPGKQLKPRDGFYDLRVTGELWESYFYDSLALMTVDHPVGTEIYTDERFDVPAVKLAVTTTGAPHPIKQAIDDRGTDVTNVVRNLDGNYLDTFGRGQYQGLTRDHFVEVDLGDSLPASAPLWLIAKGWLHPSDSTVNVAMGQGKHEQPHWLSLEVPDEHNVWHVAKANLGFPAGRNKICLIDLTGLFKLGMPHRLRLRTNLEIYWDSLEWAEAQPGTPIKVQRLQPIYADLHYRGFSTVRQANASSPELPSYMQLASTAPQWRDLSGFYTRFGDVKTLLKKTDDSYVIMNAGDELSLRFPAPAPPAPGWVRDYIIAGDGWIKDGDYNSTESKTVMPYPYHARKDYDSPPSDLEQDWEYKHHREDWLTYQTRYVDSNAFRNALQLKATP